MRQPFVVGKPVTGKYFIDRKSELKKLQGLLSGTSKGNINNVILLGLRRTGKSSILLNVKEKICKNPKVVPVIFDAYGISTKERFAKSFVNAVLASYVEKTGDRSFREKLRQGLSQGYEKVKDRLSEFDISILDLVKFQANLRERKVNENELLEAALQYPEKLAESKNISFVIMIDEFQDLLKWKDEFFKMFRRLVQSQRHIAYIFAGSAPTVMKGMVYDSKSPFYKQLIEVQVSVLGQDAVTSFVRGRLKSVKITIADEALEKIYHLSRGFPDYVQRLGLQIFLDCLEKDRRDVKVGDVERAYSEMIVQLDPDFSNLFATFSDLEKEILIALANSKDSPAAISYEIRKPMSTLPKTLTRLINQNVLEKVRVGKYRISDVVFADWLGKRYTALTL